MNERIKQLADEAGMVKILDEHANEYGAGMLENYPYPELERFAELIVRECIDTVLDSSVEYATRPQIASEIKQHFGVEDRAVPILSADEQALFAGIASSELFTIAGAKKQFKDKI